MSRPFSIAKLSALVIVGLLVLGCLPAFGMGDSRTGTNDNEPQGGYNEGSERIEIYHMNGVHDTNFNIDETINIKITSDLISSVTNKVNDNRVRVFDYLGNPVGNDYKPFFTQSGGGPPYVFDGSFVANGANGFTVNDDYLLEITFKDTAGVNKIVMRELIHVGGASVPEEKHMKLYSDPAYTTEMYEFAETSTVYVEVWTGSNPADNASSMATIANYHDLRSTKQISTLADADKTENGQYTRFAYTLSADPGPGFPLLDGSWYTLSVTMNDGSADQVVDWSVQFMINNTLANSPIIIQGATKANPSIIIAGTETTTLSTNFSHPDAPDLEVFMVTYKVKDGSNNEYTIVDQVTSGQQGLTIVQDGSNKTKYRATLPWSPPGNQPTGAYDLYFKVDDGISLAAEDAFVNNEDELTLTPPPSLPVITAGATMAKPDNITAVGPQVTVISVNFTHQDAPSADGFKVTFKVRDPGNNPPVILVNQAQHGSAGLQVTKTGATSYTANFSWDPADDAVLGGYDLYSRVEDPNGAWAEDAFDENLEELNLAPELALPTVVAGATTATPTSINRTGTEATVISTTFHHGNMPGAALFTITYTVRDESNNTYILVDAKQAGFGGLTIQDLGSGDYKSSFIWDPPDNQPTGKYDLYFLVEDASSNQAIDGFESNANELTITKKPSPPVMTAGVTKAEPDTVNVMGDATTVISAIFFHPDMPATSTFKITLQIRDVGNQIYKLLDSSPEGTPSMTLTADGLGNFTVTYTWDPPSINQPLGTYDLFTKVEDGNGLVVQDGFNNNLDELTLKKEAIAPVNSTIKGRVVDIDMKPIVNATVKVYDSATDVVVKTVVTGSDGTFSIELPVGTYDIAVQATDYKGESKVDKSLVQDTPLDLGDFVLLKLEGTTNGGKVTVTKEVVPGYMWGLVGLLVVLLVLLCLFVLMKMSKGSTEPGSTKKGHHAHERDSDEFEPDHPLEPKEKKELEGEPKPIPVEKVRIEKLKDEDEEEEVEVEEEEDDRE